MSTHLELEIESVKAKIYQMADLDIEAISESVESLKNLDLKTAEKIMRNDSIIDSLEKEIDEDIVKILVTRQPAAIDLRLVLSFMKINTDLERIGDLASNIAQETIRLNGKTLLKPLVDIPRMAVISIDMIKKSLQSMSDMNSGLAKEIIRMDSQIDDLNRQIHRELFTYMAENPQLISESLSLLWVAKALERIGDHASNIAERAVFYIEGIDIRHMGEDE
jgi:phosphate transport system protein